MREVDRKMQDVRPLTPKERDFLGAFVSVCLVVWLVLTFFGCGVSPQDAAEQLDARLADEDSWCAYDHTQPELEKAFFHPDGYGRLSTAYGCPDTGSWPGGICQMPHSLTFFVKVASDGQDSTWLTWANNERSAWRTRLNNSGWNVTLTTSASAEYRLRTGTTHPMGALGQVIPDGLHTYSAGSGKLWVEYTHCDAWLYRTEIEEDVFYQAASDLERINYVRNLWDHELSHCSGLPHCAPGTACTNTLMTETHTYPGPWFSTNLNVTTEEREWLRLYEPH